MKEETEAIKNGDTVSIELWYPRTGFGTAKYMKVGLVDVRSAGDLRISFDFDRNEWIIEQQLATDTGTGIIEEHGWRETASLPAWQMTEDEYGDRS